MPEPQSPQQHPEPRSLTLARDYPAAPERVYRAWTDVVLLRQWFGCGRGMLWNVHEWDARVGGVIHVSLEFDQGPFEIKGEFLIVERPRHLRYRWAGDQVVDVTIEARDAGSRVTVTHSGLVTDEECAFTDAGWSSALEQLDVELTHIEAPPDFVMKWFPTDEPHGGGALIQGGGRQPTAHGTVVYFNGGADLDTVLNRVESAGGTVAMPKTGDGQNGYVAFFIDTEGSRVGLQSKG
jgi:uncharacterized protein YndB with AHSA1/START domain/predicted enzyme related to lactoylglutathione lyase